MDINTGILKKLKCEYGEAFYLLDSAQFRKNFSELKEAFGSIYSNFNIAYSYKTNYTPKICKIVNELGGYAETVSEMEVELALKVGVNPHRIIWNGPIKEINKLEEFLKLGVMVNVDSIGEAITIKQFADKDTMSEFNVGIRCNFDVNDGVLSRFGFDVENENFMVTLDIIKNTPNIKLRNLQCHFAKRQVEYWPARAKGMLNQIDKLDFVPERIDLGGGLFGKMEDSLKSQFTNEIPDYNAYAQAVATLVADKFKDSLVKPELIIEPGTALVGDCMNFVGTIKTVKEVRGKTIATVWGSQKNISMSGVNPPITIYPVGDTQTEYTDVDFVGYTCIEGDVIYKSYTGKFGVEDMIVISNCGSYSLVMKPPFILPNFPVLDISEGNVEVIKHAETFDDIFQTFVF